jgi:hypothetical protein
VQTGFGYLRSHLFGGYRGERGLLLKLTSTVICFYGIHYDIIIIIIIDVLVWYVYLLFKQDIVYFDGMLVGIFVCLCRNRKPAPRGDSNKESFGVHASVGINSVDHCRKN